MSKSKKHVVGAKKCKKKYAKNILYKKVAKRLHTTAAVKPLSKRSHHK